jgi:hypothetical protein
MSVTTQTKQTNEEHFVAQSIARAGNTQITFDFENGHIAGDFDGGDICIDGGVVMLRELDERRGYAKKIAGCISDWRSGPVVHEIEDLVRMQLFMKGCGYSDGNDANLLRNDAAFRAAAGKDFRDLASQPSISRFENNVDAESVLRLQRLLPKMYLNRFKRAPKRVVLNMDSMCDPVYGTQQMSFYNGFYHDYCYTHLYLFADDGYPLGGVVRAGNAGPAEGGLSMLAAAVGELRTKRKGMNVEYRADSAFLNFQTLDWCEENRVTYYIGLAPNNVLHTKVRDLVLEAREQFVAIFGEPAPIHGKTWRQNEERIRYSSKEEGRLQELLQRDRRIRLYAEVRYAAGSWSRERRVIVRIDYTDEGEDLRFVVTNCESGTARRLYEQKYCMRARCENHIKELKSQRCDRLSCQEWLPNQVRLLMHLLSYGMQVELREFLPSGDRHISTQTLRERYLKVAAQIRHTTRGTRIRWSSTHPHQTEFRTLLDRLRRAC